MSVLEMSLQVMWKGMLSIVIVIAIIIACTYILQFVMNKIEKYKQSKVNTNIKEGEN